MGWVQRKRTYPCSGPTETETPGARSDTHLRAHTHFLTWITCGVDSNYRAAQTEKVKFTQFETHAYMKCHNGPAEADPYLHG